MTISRKRFVRTKQGLLVSLVGIVIVTAAASAPVAGQEQADRKVDLRGVIVDRETGAPIPGAYVELLAAKRTVYTDAEGRFAFSRFSPGVYTLVAAQLGYVTDSIAVALAADGAATRIELTPDPVVLEGVQVVADRLKARRNALPFNVRAYDANQLAVTGSFDAFDFIRTRMITTRCPARAHASYCVVRRGRTIVPSIYIDEVRFIGGLDVLMAYNTSDIHLIEVLNSGAQIRVYTKGFAERLALGRAHLATIFFY